MVFVLFFIMHCGDKVEKLINQLHKGENIAREEAAIALGKTGDKRAVEPLIAALEDDDMEVRRDVAEALGRIGDKRAVEPLIAALKDDDDFRWSAAKAIEEIGKPAIESLIAALKDDNYIIRRYAAMVLGHIIGDKRAVEPLIAAMKDDNMEVRRDVAEALGRIGDKRAVEPLIVALKDDDMEVRRDVAEALGRIGDKRAVEPLIAALNNYALGDGLDEQESVMVVLGKIGDKRAIPALVRSLTKWFVNVRAGETLEKLAWHPQSMEDKVHLLIAKKDYNTLMQMWDRTKQVLLKDMESDKFSVVYYAVNAFIVLDRKEMTSKLIDILNKKEAESIADAKIIAGEYLNCGNFELRDAAKRFAKKHGYKIIPWADVPSRRWGSW